MAVFSVIAFSDVFNVARSTISEPSKYVLTNPDKDIDHDGLLNVDESYWNTDFKNPDTDGDGFLDGEEVASRHDPTMPGPDDSLENINVTDKLANLAVGGIMNGSLKPSNPAFQKTMDTLALSIVDDSIASLEPDRNISKIKTIDSTTENQRIYIKDVQVVWEMFLKTLMTEAKEIGTVMELMNNGGMANPKFIEYFIIKTGEFNFISRKWVEISVPKNWLAEHDNFLNPILQMVKINKALAEGKDDPIKAGIGINLLINLVDEIPVIFQPFIDKIQSENI